MKLKTLSISTILIASTLALSGCTTTLTTTSNNSQVSFVDKLMCDARNPSEEAKYIDNVPLYYNNYIDGFSLDKLKKFQSKLKKALNPKTTCGKVELNKFLKSGGTFKSKFEKKLVYVNTRIDSINKAEESRIEREKKLKAKKEAERIERNKMLEESHRQWELGRPEREKKAAELRKQEVIKLKQEQKEQKQADKIFEENLKKQGYSKSDIKTTVLDLLIKLAHNDISEKEAINKIWNIRGDGYFYVFQALRDGSALLLSSKYNDIKIYITHTNNDRTFVKQSRLVNFKSSYLVFDGFKYYNSALGVEEQVASFHFIYLK